MTRTKCDLAVVGGGPAGFFGALRCATLNPAAEIVILEKTERVLQKVLMSGGGRCNITHDCEDPQELIRSYPRGGKSLLSGFYAFGPADTLDWFRQRGLDFYTDDIGCVFPATDSAQSVVDVLLKEAEQLGVRIWQEAGVQRMLVQEGQFLLDLPHDNQLSAKKVLFATGGNRQGFRVLREIGLPVMEPVPSLFPLRLQESWLSALAGLAVEGCTLSIPQTSFTAQGTVLLTHRGISGPGAIRLSSWAARYLKERKYHSPLVVDWLADAGTQEITLQQLLRWKNEQARKQVQQQSPFPQLALRFWRAVCEQLPEYASKRWGNVSSDEINALGQCLRTMPLNIIGRDQHKQEYVTCGGVDLESVNLRTMESKLFPGLFFAGEVLDIDGLTGGYNLQNCWTTGWMAGTALAQSDVS